jgi:hypothetical protein
MIATTHAHWPRAFRWRNCNKPQQSATKCIERHQRDDRAYISSQVEALQNARNASKCFALRLGSSPIQSGHRDHIADHTATTRGYTGATRVPVKTGQCHPKRHCTRANSHSSFCKPLQNAAICFNLLQSALQENAIFCNGMLRNVSF